MSDIYFECPNCKQTLDAPSELATQLIDCPICKQTIEVPVRSQIITAPEQAEPAPLPPSAATPPPQSERRCRFDHTVVVLHFDRRGFALTRSDILQGLTEESSAQLRKLGDEGWELVTVLPYSIGKAGFFDSSTQTDAALGFFKRALF